MQKVTKQKNGRYQRSIVIGHDSDGKVIRKFFTAKTQRELDSKIAEFKSSQSKGIPAINSSMTFAQISALWLDQYNPLVGLTRRKRCETVVTKNLNPIIGALKLKDIRKMHLQGIINDMAQSGYAEKTMSELKQIACQVLDMAVDNDMIARNPFATVKVPKVEREERKPIGELERRLIEEHYASHYMGVPSMIMLYCGLRKGELLALEWSDIDFVAKTLTISKSAWFDNNRVAVKPPKSRAGCRVVPIPDKLVAILQTARNSATDALVCPRKTGGLCTHTTYVRYWASFIRHLNLQAGGKDASRSNPKVWAIDNFTAHQLRHTYATMLYDAGVDMLTAQKHLGHSDVQTTMRIYTHLSERKEQGSVEAWNEYVSGI